MRSFLSEASAMGASGLLSLLGFRVWECYLKSPQPFFSRFALFSALLLFFVPHGLQAAGPPDLFGNLLACVAGPLILKLSMPGCEEFLQSFRVLGTLNPQPQMWALIAPGASHQVLRQFLLRDTAFEACRPHGWEVKHVGLGSKRIAGGMKSRTFFDVFAA